MMTPDPPVQASPRRDPARRARPDVAGWALGSLAAYLLGVSIWMLIAPRAFFDALGPFGTYNEHYVRDAATFQLALGVLALLAVRRAELRLAAISVIGIQFLAHAANHLVDIDGADPAWVGVADFVGLALAGAGLGWLLLKLRGQSP